ncbi:nucleoside triphosphate pyrophosphohydrolase family protein [Microlunatus parietis]|uniref:NTP pyrophosphatase (Non-canonical NTP hydrolase) n=1 Tax=Microlunatus parietis TaxID=682979 RepID=A0A7Y9LBA8_9ACTN|nr:hypothetical protein [Microlunatus parietis]NYE71522.1 NTP pyrophosphatase (non-canonical NTP hydrolase) [Microlunatus parietis]
MSDLRHDRFAQVYAIADRYAARFPEGNTPLGYLARLTEELGEIAVEVQRLEGAPAKIAKHGDGEVAALADEVEDLLHTAFGLLRLYGAESIFERVVDREFAKTI